jgi:hypothetical protein
MHAARIVVVTLAAAAIAVPRLAPAAPPTVAPFFADVDTRAAGSGPVTWSSTPATFAGRPALCVDWGDVGYYDRHDDKLDRFQLLVVDRSDVKAGDFDLVMNYDTIRWEAGSASGGVSGLGGTSAAVCYASGTGDPTQLFERPGSFVNGALLDTSSATGLTQTSRNSLVPGRHVYEVRDGVPPTGGTVAGLVTDVAAQPIAGAPVQVCRRSGGACVLTATGALGQYLATAVPPGDAVVTVSAPGGSALMPGSVDPVHVGTLETARADVVLRAPAPTPPGVEVAPSRGGGAVPVVCWDRPVTVELHACPGGSGTWDIEQGGAQLAGGELVEGSPGAYTAVVEPLRPATGLASLRAEVVCPGGGSDTFAFDVYIDPSGTVRTLQGDPVPGAVVTLLRADGAAFEQVPDGSAVMSSVNRRNPDLTDADGRFGWDVVAGRYKVRAQADGCTAPGGGPYAETGVLEIPPAVVGLELRLDCPMAFADATPPTTQADAGGAGGGGATASGPVRIVLTSTDDAAGAGVAAVHYELSGVESGAGMIRGDRAVVDIATPGETTLRYWAVDVAGNVEPARSLRVQVGGDTAPTASPAVPAGSTGGGCGCGAGSAADGADLALLVALGRALRRRGRGSAAGRGPGR